MNKKRSILLVVMLLIALSGCSAPGNSRKSLYEHGMDVVALMEEMVDSSSYESLMSGAAEIEQMRQTLAALATSSVYTAAKTFVSSQRPKRARFICIHFRTAIPSRLSSPPGRTARLRPQALSSWRMGLTRHL